MRLPDFGKCGLFIAMLLAVAGLRAQTVIEPARKGNTAFAVIVDSMTYVECAPQIGSYGKTLEEEGLPTFIVYKNWKAPEEVREVLRNLYEREKLEGAVFVGDIPIPMITKAQHLTSAFKMDERKHPLREASVPSDRFYEDFDLKFIPIPDSTQGLLFFYQLAPASPQFITSDIYSGRIKAQKSNGDPYAQIAAYLEKAVKAHRENNRLDQVVSYTGDGSYSNSLTAWRAEQQIMNEQFGDMFTRQRGLKFLRYSMAPYMKDYIIKELRRDDLDLMVFHEHGMPNRQYLTGDPETFDFDTHMESVKEYLRGMVRRDREKADPFARARAEADRLGVDSSWYRNALTPEMLLRDSLTDLRKGIVLEDVNGIRPNARFVIFDACYNGDFREDDFIAGKYVFADGKCVAAFANSVNVLQDKSAFDLLGLLGCGARLGAWARHINILESHIIGDPTFRFAPVFETDIDAVSTNEDPRYWLGRLDDPLPDMQNYALIKLYLNDYPGISDLLYKTYCESPYAVVRYNCLHLLESLNDAHFRKALLRSTADNFEFIRRIGVHRMGLCGDEAFIPVLIDAYIDDRNSARVVFNITQSLLCFDKDRVLEAIDRRFAKADFCNAGKYKAELVRLVSDNPSAESLKTLSDKSQKTSWRQLYIAFLKNRPYHQIVPGVLKELKDTTNDDYIRVQIAEALAWFGHSVRRDEILATCRDLLKQGKCSPELARELTRACARLESVK